MGKKDVFVYVPCDQCDGTGKLKVSKLGVLRKKAGLDQVAVAEKLGLSRTSISNIEQGKQAIDIKYIAPLSEMYGIEEFEMYQLAKRLAAQPNQDSEAKLMKDINASLVKQKAQNILNIEEVSND